MTFDEWLQVGVDSGFCSGQFCETHDGHPMHDTEVTAWAEGNNFCVQMVRLGTPNDWTLDVA